MPQPKVPSKGSVTRRGFAVLRVAIWEEPWVFTWSVLASALYGAMTVADGWALGWSTDHVIRPALERGDTTFGAVASLISLFLGIAVLRAIGVVGRRVGAGVMQYRLQATYRRRVTRQYLKLPLEWHHKHPTGQLLSNANADVESTWYPIAPLPMAVGVIAMLAFATVAMFAADPWLASSAVWCFRWCSWPTSSSSGRCSRLRRALSSFAPMSPRSRTSRSTARWW